MAIKSGKELQFKDYYIILFKHKILIVVSAVAFLVPTWLIRSKIPDSFFTYGQLAIESSEEEKLLLTPDPSQKTVGYYTGIFKSRAFQDILITKLEGSYISKESIEKKRAFISNHIKIVPGTFNSFLKIQCGTYSPQLSYKLATAATDSLIVFCQNMENQETEKIIEVIQQYIEKTAENYNRVLKEKNKITNAETQGDIGGLSALEQAYEKQLVDFELDRAEFRAKKVIYKALDKKVNASMPVTNKLRRKLQKKLSKLNREKEKREKLGIPGIAGDSLSRQIASLEKEIEAISKKEVKGTRDLNLISKWKESKNDVAKSESSLNYKKTKINSLRKATTEYKKSHPNIAQHEFEVTRLEDLLNRYTATHKRLSVKLEDELIKSQSHTGGLKIVEAPYKPTEPEPRNDIVFYIISLVAGLSVGIGLSLLREFLDDSIHTPDDIEKHLALPVLGTIPHIVIRKNDLTIKRSTSAKKASDISFKYPELILKGGADEGIIAESYRSLRTNILFASPDEPIQAFLVTSSGPHEGKSLTAANTALAFAFQGHPTVLCDADLRRPIDHHLFNLERGPGLGDLFAGTHTIDEVVQTTEDTPLNVITAGSFLPNPSEALGSKKFQSILAELKKKFKYIIFDTPPIIAVTDACILASKIDGAILVTRSGRTGFHVAQRSLQTLEKVNANIIGCILNDVNLGKSGGYYGYYKNYYHYYHTAKG